MPAPIFGLAALINVAFAGWRAKAIGLAFLAFKEQIYEIVYQWAESDDFAGFATNWTNARLREAGIDAQFTNLLNVDAINNDVDKMAAQRVNAKIGTEFTSLKSVGRDDALKEVGRVMGDRINAETGANLQTIWPVEKFRDELGTELMRQFDAGVDLPSGSLFPHNRLVQIQAALLKNMAGYVPPTGREPADPVKAAKNRDRQAKYRRSHKRVWVNA